MPAPELVVGDGDFIRLKLTIPYSKQLLGELMDTNSSAAIDHCIQTLRSSIALWERLSCAS